MPYINSEWNKNTNNNASFGDLCENGGVSPKAFMMDNKGYGRFSDVAAPYAPAIKAYGWLDRNNLRKITIEYSYSDTNSSTGSLISHETFVGEKIK